MSALINNIANVGRKINRFDPVDRAVQNFVMGRPNPGTRYYGEASPGPPGPPTQDTAANASLQQQYLQRLRRGVAGNIYAGGNAAAPQVASKSTLGN